MAKEYSLAYGGVTLGGASADYHIDGPFTYDEAGADGGKLLGHISCEVIVVASPQYGEAGFAAACAALEAAFTKPRQDMVLTLGSTTLKTWSHSSNTGFNARPRIEKIGSPEDTGRSRRYRVSVEVDLPADLAGQSGRRESSIEINYDPSRIRTITISGKYTALGASSARAQYESASPTYFTSVISGLTGGGTFEIIDETVTNDDANKTADFKIVYRELIYNQTSSALDSTTIVKHTVTFAKIQPSADSSMKTVKALSKVVATYSAHVNKTVSTDLLELWNNTLKGYVVAQFNSIFLPSVSGISSNSPTIDKTNNTISCTLEFTALFQGDDYVASEITEEMREQPGFLFTGSYGGNPVGMHVDVAWHTILRITNRHDILRGSTSAFDNAAITPPSSTPGPDGNWYLIDFNVKSRKIYVGIPGDPQIPLTEYNYTIVERYVEKPKGAAVTTPGDTAGKPGGAVPVTTPNR